MDNQNTLAEEYGLGAEVVLILVLMDNQNTADVAVIDKHLGCLNPCSNG